MSDEPWITNRVRRLMPKFGQFWCLCDRRFVRDWKRCPGCGRRNGKYRFKAAAR